MRIGLDFDNTLACYDKVFPFVARNMGLLPGNWSGGKADIRTFMRNQPQGETYWQRLQGQVYGKYMNRAVLYPEVANFLLRLKARGDEAFIVSHKTEFGHCDPEQVPLRREALRWMQANRFFDSAGFGLAESNVFFENTREAKVKKIADLECDLFIDDLWEVFAEQHFPLNTKKILFGSSTEGQKAAPCELISKSWREIAQHVFGTQEEEEVRAQIEFALGDVVDSTLAIEGRANSRVFMVKSREEAFAIKFYPDVTNDVRDRLGAERSASEFLNSHGVKSTVEVVSAVRDLNIGVYRWVEGVNVSSIRNSDIEQALEFIEQLHNIRHAPNATAISNASEACLREEDIWNQIAYKRSNLNIVTKRSPDLEKYLLSEFDPLFAELSRLTIKRFPKRSRLARLPKKDRTLSPSDFGFHNAIRKEDGSLVWIDFEYFGWDDPVKLISDFIWHPGFSLSAAQTRRWKTGCLEIFAGDKDLTERFLQRFPLYGLRWCLILLNIFFRPESDSESRGRIQLEKARTLLGTVEKAVVDADITT